MGPYSFFVSGDCATTHSRPACSQLTCNAIHMGPPPDRALIGAMWKFRRMAVMMLIAVPLLMSACGGGASTSSGGERQRQWRWDSTWWTSHSGGHRVRLGL
jgi:hypothetical protein